jgi:hypothetical protein
MILKTYSELSKLKTFEDRFQYLRLDGIVGEETFGFDRYLNQILYQSKEWKRCRRDIIIRDEGCDLGCEGFEIHGRILIHHINPITVDDIVNRNPKVFDPENLILTSHNTHQAIHYGDENLLIKAPIERSKNDTCLWRRN